MGTDNRSTATPSPQEQVMGVVMGITQGRSLVAAAELGLPDALAGGPFSVEAIAAKVQADADNVFRLMRALETIGVFKQVSPRVFENTPMSECMRKDVSGSQWAFLRIWGECPTGSRKSAATVNTSYPTFCISAMLSSSRSRCAFSIQRCS